MKIFGGCARWAADLGPPDPGVPARAALAAAGEAVRRATGAAAGPVHLNLQFREPLAPLRAAWPASALRVRGRLSGNMHAVRVRSALLVRGCDLRRCLRAAGAGHGVHCQAVHRLDEESDTRRDASGAGVVRMAPRTLRVFAWAVLLLMHGSK